MSWNNQNGGNGRFGPFDNPGGGSFQSGLTDQSTSPLTPPAPTAPPPPPTGPSGVPATGGPANSGRVGGSYWDYKPGDPMPGILPTTQASTMGMADGGLIPAQGGTVAPDLDTALASVQSALGTGRKAFGLPSDLLGEGGDQGNDSDSDSNKNKQDGSTWQPPQDFVEAAQETPEQQMDKAYIPAVTGIGSGMATALRNDSLPPVPGPAMSQGGVIPAFDDGGDMDTPSEQSSPQPQDNVPSPQPGQTQPANDPQQALKAYAMGAGAMPPDQALALEQRVDPQGTMDPSQRKLMAVAAAQDPKAQFSLLQHYRQRFQALSAFARAAATGTQARPANISASTDAATRAFHNVPNGHSISFAPAGPGKVAVTMANYAGGSKQKSYAAGGPVPDDTPDPEDSGPEAMSGMPPDIGGALQGGAEGAQDTEADADQTMTQPVSADDAKGLLPTPENPLITGARVAGKVVRGVQGAEKAAEGGVKQTVMSVSDYLNALKNSMYDAYLGKTEPDQVLSKAAQGGGSTPDETPAAPAAARTAKPTPIVYGNADQAPGEPASSAAQQADQDVRPFGNDPNEITVLPEHPTRAQIDAFNASNGGNRGGGGGSDPIVDRIQAQAQAAFPFASQGAQRSAYIADALKTSQGQQGQVELQKLRNQGMKDLWGTKEGAINSRNAATNTTRLQVAQMQAMQRAWAAGQRDFTSLVNSQRAAAPGLTPEQYAKAALATIQNGGPIGMPFQAPGAGAPQQGGQPAQPAPITGPIAVNPATGQRMTVRNGQWVPIPPGQ